MRITVGECSMEIIPVVKGLVSEKEKVVEALKGDFEAACIPLGIEDLEALRRRSEITDEPEPSDADAVYSYFLKKFGDIDMPDPSMAYLVDECTARNIPIVPLQMNDEEYSKAYCECINTLEFLREKRLLKKAMKKGFDMSSPETFVMQWDALMNGIKGFRQMADITERYMADQLVDVAKYRKNVIVLMDYERMDNVLAYMEN